MFVPLASPGIEANSTSMKTLLTMSNISYQIQGKSILQQVDLTVHEKEIVTIVGPNGAGKTTLLSIALGLIKPGSGSVVQHKIDGKPLRIGYVPQLVNRDTTMPISVMEFMQLARHCPPKKEVLALLSDLALSALSSSFLSDLSGGELRRVLFARALLNHPHLLVLDEPTAGVDVAGQEHFYKQLNALRDRYHFAILMVSHDLHLVMSATDRVICLNQHICCQGQPAQVVNNPQYSALFDQENPANQDELSELAFYQHKHDHTH